MKKHLFDRYNVLIALFIIIGLLFVLKLVNLQIVNGEYYDELSKNGLATEEKVTALRGNILDRNGDSIAGNRVGLTVNIIRTRATKPKLNAMLFKLDKLFRKNGDSCFETFNKVISYPIKWGTSFKLSESPIARFISEFGLSVKNAEKIKTAKDAFDYLRTNEYEVDSKYSTSEAYRIITMRYEMRNSTLIKSVRVANDVSEKTVAKIEEMNAEFFGVSTGQVPFRKYYGSKYISHVLGYVRGISEEELAADDTYSMNDMIGKAGIEQSMEKNLRGTDGLKRVQIDLSGKTTSEIIAKSSIPGSDVVLTIDKTLQKVAAESLKNTIIGIRNKTVKNSATSGNMGDAFSGSVVAINVNTGEVLAMASYPSYDSAVYLENETNKAARKLIEKWNMDGRNLPMYNRAIQSGYANGSTYKPVVATAGLENKIITKDSYISCRGTYYADNWPFHCLEYPVSGHGPLTLRRGLATSCNLYFQQLGVMAGIKQVDKWAKLYGLGELTGIELPGEKKGIRSNPETKKIYHPKDGVWGNANTAMTSIGQFDNLFTPVQLANYAATLANGGKRYKVHIVKRIVNFDGTIIRETQPQYEKLPASKSTYAAIKEGMIAATTTSEGTASSLFAGVPYTVAAKTGTAETPESNHSNNGVFICYAPVDKPKIAIAVVVERGVWGSLAGNCPKAILDEFFKEKKVKKISDKVQEEEIRLTR